MGFAHENRMRGPINMQLQLKLCTMPCTGYTVIKAGTQIDQATTARNALTRKIDFYPLTNIPYNLRFPLATCGVTRFLIQPQLRSFVEIQLNKFKSFHLPHREDLSSTEKLRYLLTPIFKGSGRISEIQFTFFEQKGELYCYQAESEKSLDHALTKPKR